MKPNRFISSYLKDNISSYLYKGEDFTEFKRFDMGESAFPFTPKVFEKLSKLKQGNFHDYPDPCLFEIKKEIAKLFNVKPTMVTTGCGSDEIIELIPRIVMNEGEKALAITPTFFRFLDSVSRMNCKTALIKTNEENEFAITDNVINQAIKRANQEQVKLFWICNPNNPTGVMMSREQVKRILDETNCFVVVDEALHEFVDPSHKQSAVTLINGRKNLIVLRTLSKAYGLAGIRFGFGIGDEQTIRIFENFRLPYNSSSISQEIALTVLKDQKHLQNTIIKTNKIKSELIDDLKKIQGLHIASQSMTNTILLKHNTKDLFEELRKKKILVADFRNAAGLEGKNYVRIVVRDKSMNALLIRALRKLSS